LHLGSRPRRRGVGCRTVGQRSASETVARIMLAFTEQRTWTQAELARRLELAVPAVRRHLMELRAGGMPLERDDEDRPQVFWSVPKGWFPGGLVLEGAEVHRLLGALLHLPRSARRDRLLR
jgi:DNA-binding transcriptional ArsR family regulator